MKSRTLWHEWSNTATSKTSMSSEHNINAFEFPSSFLQCDKSLVQKRLKSTT